VLSLFRQPRRGRQLPGWVPTVMAALVLMLLISARMNDYIATQRLGHVVTYCGLVWALGTGRVSLVSAARGMAISLIVCVVQGVVFFGQSTYEGRLTGILNDPNAAATLLVTLG